MMEFRWTIIKNDILFGHSAEWFNTIEEAIHDAPDDLPGDVYIRIQCRPSQLEFRWNVVFMKNKIIARGEWCESLEDAMETAEKIPNCCCDYLFEVRQKT